MAQHTRIASLPVGFGEGYPRALFNKGVVLIHGKRCPVIGRVSLNVLTIDVTNLETSVDEAVQSTASCSRLNFAMALPKLTRLELRIMGTLSRKPE